MVALQYWAEQNNPPTRGEPHLLVESVLELREEVRWYLSFTDEEVFKGVALLRKRRRKVCRMGEGVAPIPTQWWLSETSPNLPESQSKGGKRKVPYMVSMKPLVSPPKTPAQPQPSQSMHALALA